MSDDGLTDAEAVELLSDMPLHSAPAAYLMAARRLVRGRRIAADTVAAFERALDTRDASPPGADQWVERGATPLLAGAPLAAVADLATRMRTRWAKPRAAERRILQRVEAVLQVRQGTGAGRWTDADERFLLGMLDLNRPPLGLRSPLAEWCTAHGIDPGAADTTALGAAVHAHAPAAAALIGGTLAVLPVVLDAVGPSEPDEEAG